MQLIPSVRGNAVELSLVQHDLYSGIKHILYYRLDMDCSHIVKNTVTVICPTGDATSWPRLLQVICAQQSNVAGARSSC